MEKHHLHKKRKRGDGVKHTITHVDVSVLVHVTENVQKVLKAVRKLFPSTYSDAVSFKTENLFGHHKNLIILIKTTIREKTIVEALIKNVYNNLDGDDKDKLFQEFNQRLNAKKTFFVRLDKQKAYLGKIKLGNIDPILIKIKLNFIPTNFTEIVNSIQ